MIRHCPYPYAVYRACILKGKCGTCDRPGRGFRGCPRRAEAEKA